MHPITNIYSSPVQLDMARIDKVDPLVSGNKWYKLKYNLIEAKNQGFKSALTFGGAYSNHIHAMAAAASNAGLKCIGVIRGEETLPLNETLKFAAEKGMELHYVSRSDYRNKNDDEFIKKLKERFGEFYLVPEGGSNSLALKGVAELVGEIGTEYDYWVTPVGTGGTLAGLVKGLEGKGNVIGISSLKGAFGLKDDIDSLLSSAGGFQYNNWKIIHDYHFGGYAKMTRELYGFIKDFQKDTGILLDPVYTSKMMFGILQLVDKGYFPNDSRIIALHTGGLQGWNGMSQRFTYINESFPFDGA